MTRCKLSTALLLLLVLGAGCRDRPEEPKEIETIDVTPPLEIDTSEDPEAAPRREGIAGILPQDFPRDLPLYVPASLIDFGESAAGRPTVTLLSPHEVSRVRRELYSKLSARGWESSAGRDGAVVLRKGRKRAWLTLEDGRPGTRYQYEYEP